MEVTVINSFADSPTTPSTTIPSSEIARRISIIIAFSIFILTITYFIIICAIARKISYKCCSSERWPVNNQEMYTTVSVEEILGNNTITYGGSQSELSNILEISSSATSVTETLNSVTESDFDNLSLNPVIHDHDIIDMPPQYEHPPPYESPQICTRNANA